MSFGRFEHDFVSGLPLSLVPPLPPTPGLDPSSFFSTQHPIVSYDATATPTAFWFFLPWAMNDLVFFAPNSTVWSPPKPLQSLAVNNEPMECNAPLSPSPVPPPILPDITDVSVLTSPVLTSAVSCYTDSFADLDFAALLKKNEEVDCLQQTLGATRAELG